MIQPVVSFTLALFAVAFASPAPAMRIASATFADGSTLGMAQVYDGYGCAGGNMSPELHWSGAPRATKSFALTMWDPDAPVAGGWWHWVAFGIPAGTLALPLGAGGHLAAGAPKGLVEVPTSFGKPGYGGPCPPAGSKPHHYIFTIYALDAAKLRPAPASGPALLIAIKRHVLAKAIVTGLYGR